MAFLNQAKPENLSEPSMQENLEDSLYLMLLQKINHSYMAIFLDVSKVITFTTILIASFAQNN